MSALQYVTGLAARSRGRGFHGRVRARNRAANLSGSARDPDLEPPLAGTDGDEQ